MKIFILVGTRPNFIKVTMFKKEALNYPGMEIKLIHTGQHYSHSMERVFIKELNLPEPKYKLNIKSSGVGRHGRHVRTARPPRAAVIG